jgi:hypothetical protein
MYLKAPVSDIKRSISMSILFTTSFAHKQSLRPSFSSLVTLSTITVADCQIRAAKPADPFQSDPMPHGDAEKAIWWNNQLVDFAGRINHTFTYVQL